MPTLAPRLCPGCGTVVRGKCPTCTAASQRYIDRQRGNSASRGYGSHWRRSIRPAFLKANPLCCLCGALATIPDHWPLTRATLVARGVPDPDAFERLRALCDDCHRRHGEHGISPDA